MELDDIAFKGMNVRDMLRQAYKDDWNSRRRVLELVPGDVFSVSITLSSVGIPPDLAKAVLLEVMKEEAAAPRKG